MINTKLILLEGLPCTGKSSLGKNLYTFFSNYQNILFYDELDIKNPIMLFPFYDYDFNDISIISYLKKHIIKQWQKFIDLIENDNKIYIIDGRYIHNTLLPMYSFCASDIEIFKLFACITNIISRVNTKLIYLDYNTIDEFLSQYLLLRGNEKMIQDISLVKSLPLSLKNNYTDKTGWITFWEILMIYLRKLKKNRHICIFRKHLDT